MKVAIALVAAMVGVLAAASGSALAEERHEERGRAPVVERAPHVLLDQRYHHDHYYPARGAFMRVLPTGSVGVGFRGDNFFFHAGVWLHPVAGGGFSVIVPPIGIVVPILPPSSVALSIGGAPYYYANSVYYAPVPGQGYTVVTPPPGADVAQPAPPSPPPMAAQPVVYPRNGQNAAQTETDRQQCSAWATAQPGAASDGGVYQRGWQACMDGRGYTVR